MSAALYVYAIVPGEDADAIAVGLAGIDGRPVRAVIGQGGVAALVHEGDPVPYQGADEDVKRWILEHSEVVDHAWQAANTVLPVTFNVLVRAEGGISADDRLRTWLGDETVKLHEALDRLRGRAELRIEIALHRESVAGDDEEVRAIRAEMETKPHGLRRLLGKKLEQVERRAAERLADRLYPEYRRRIAALAEEMVEQRRSTPPAEHVSVLSAAILVNGESMETVGSELAAIQAEQPAARIRFLGPWPPYSFADSADLTPDMA